MDLIHATVGTPAPGTCIVRAHRLVRVKFVALPMDATPANALGEMRVAGSRLGNYRGRLISAIHHFVLRVIGRLVAARP